MSWLRSVVDEILNQVPKNKLVLGLGNFGYDWSATGVGGKSVSVGGAYSLVKQNNATFEVDPSSQNRFSKYLDSGGADRIVWVLDKYSVGASLEVAKQQGLRNFVLYRLGSEDPEVWQVFGGK